MAPESQERTDLQKTPRSRRQLPVCMSAIMWNLGLIEFSKPTAESDSDSPVIAVNGKWRRRLLSVTSRLYLMILVFAQLLCGFTYVIRFFGVANNFYHFASFLLTYWPLIVSVSLLCLLTSVRQWLHNKDHYDGSSQWWTVLSESSVSRRFQPFVFSTFRPPKSYYFIFFCLVAFVNISMQIVHVILATGYSKDKMVYVYHFFELATSIHSTWFFSIFCYYLFLQRIALEVHFDDLLWFVKTNAGDIVKCRPRLNACFKDYLRLRQLVRPWITLVICSTTFGLAVHIAWNYKALGTDDNGGNYVTVSPLPHFPITNLTAAKKSDFYFLNTLIFVDKLSVLLLALLAVGGSDVNYIWRRYVFTLNVMRSSRHEKFWDKLSKSMKKFNLDTSSDTIIDLLLPVLLLALGILGISNFDF